MRTKRYRPMLGRQITTQAMMDSIAAIINDRTLGREDQRERIRTLIDASETRSNKKDDDPVNWKEEGF